MEKLFQQPTVR